MLDLVTKQQKLGKLDTLLLCSIGRYEEILTLFETLNSDAGDKSPATLDSRGSEVLQLQAQATLADQELITILSELDPAESAQLAAHSLMAQRHEIMQRILVQNRSLLSGIKNIQSLLAHEIKEIQGGRTALNGYRQTTSSQNGGILNDAR